jgi:type IV pilus assembly protein PilE
MKKNSCQSKGFTLIELVIVVAIIAVLSAIAIPAYRQYVLRSNRTSATRALQDMATREENYYFTNNAYTNSTTNLGLTSAVTPDGYYTLSIPSASSTDYTLLATPTPGSPQTQDVKCLNFQLQRNGTETATGTSGSASCWQGH